MRMRPLKPHWRQYTKDFVKTQKEVMLNNRRNTRRQLRRAERRRARGAKTAATSSASKPDSASDSDENETEVSHNNSHAPANSLSHPLSLTELAATAPRQRLTRKRTRLRIDRFSSLVSEILDIPTDLWCPATNVVQPRVARTFVINTNTNANQNESLLDSEIEGNRLLQAYVDYMLPDGTIRRGRIQLDTQSNINYAMSEIALPRERRPWEATVAQGVGTLFQLGEPNVFTIMKENQPVRLDAVAGTPSMFNDGCVALRGLDALTMLGVDLNHHMGHDEHVQLKFKDNSLDNQVCNRAKDIAIKRYPASRKLYTQLIRTTYLSERICAAYLERNPSDYESKTIEKSSIDIAPSMSKEHRDMILALLHRFDHVFARRTNELPKPLKGVEPHVFKLKPDAVPSRTGRPRFGPAQTALINEWVTWGLDTGLIEPATTTSWSSRLILAPKYKGNTPKSALPDGIRVAWAGTGANDQILKTVPTYPNAWDQLYKVANFKYKFSADGLKQYWSVPLAKKSREVTAFWTPSGL